MSQRLFLFLFSALVPLFLNAQVTSDPEFPVDTESVTIYFNAEGTPLEGYTGDLYTHTGVILEGETEWSHVIGTWGVNSSQPLLTRIEPNHYSLAIGPDIRTYYDIQDGEAVSKLAFVFRASAGSPQSADLFIDVFSNELSVLITSPDKEEFIELISEDLTVNAASPGAELMQFYINDTWVYEDSSTAISYTFDLDALANPWDEFWIIAKALNGDNTALDSLHVTVIPEPTVEEKPAEYMDGVNVLSDNSVALVLYAPVKEFVFAVGDFTDWKATQSGYMKVSPDGDYFWLTLDGLDGQTWYRYQYDVNSEVRVADPYTELVLDPWNDPYITPETFPDLPSYPEDDAEHIVSAFKIQQDQYEWLVEDFEAPAPKDLIVYELLIRDFTEEQNIQGVIDNFDYLLDLGVNAIELMPVNEFEGNLSWGYNPSFYFALDKYYGTKNKLKELIDLCHQNDIAVILDMVLNHQFGQSSLVRMYWDSEQGVPSTDNPWFNQYPTHPYNVGYDMNHESVQTKDFSKRVMQFWLEEYKVDGYRFDLSKGFTQTYSGDNVGLWGQYDASRIAIWNEYEDFIHSVDEDAYVILEHFADNSEEKVLSNNEMLLWGNINHNYAEATMGYINGSSDFNWIDYQNRGWSNPYVVGYMESHDEERLMYKNVTYGSTSGDYNLKDTTLALQRMELAATFFIPLAGPKMIWMFGETGYDYSIDFNGRTGEKPVRWDYYDDYRRKFLYDVYSSLVNLKMEYKDVFNQPDYDLDVDGTLRTVKVNHQDMNVFIAGNFGMADESASLDFQHSGWWYEFFTGDSVNVESVPYSMEIEKGHYALYTDVKITSPMLFSNIDEINNSGIAVNIYPNPVSDKIYFDLYLDNDSNIAVTISDIQGRAINLVNEQHLPAGAHSLSWDVNDLSLETGIYVLSVNYDGSVLTRKFIVK